jgi:hypothetical protein
VQIKPNAVTLTATRFDASKGAIVVDATLPPLTIPAPARAPETIRLALSCQGPFASVDPDASHTHRGGRTNTNKIFALRRSKDVPVIHPTSIAGSLRARAAWLCAAQGLGHDNRFLEPRWKSPGELSPVQRLFGVAGWRGLVRIARLSPISAMLARELTSIALDRFSGAVLDGALFVHEVFAGVTFDLDLVLDERRFSDGKSYPVDVDRKLLEDLIVDIAHDGLLLGHGTNRGFGWFEVTVSRDRRAAA